MGRFLLFIVAGCVVSSAILFGTDPDRGATESHIRAQNQALVRETSEDALATVLEDAIDPATQHWRKTLSIGPSFTVDGHRVRIESYNLEDSERTAVVSLVVVRGGVSHRTEGHYRISEPDWPSPLWVASPYVVARVDKRAQIDGTDPERGARPIYFDASRFDEYRLASVLKLSDLDADFAQPIRQARGDTPEVRIAHGMADILDQYDTPSLPELLGAALAAFDPSRDTRFPGAHTVSGHETYQGSGGGGPQDTRIVIVGGALTVPAGARLTGRGILIIRGNVVVEGALEWDGLVLVTDPDGPAMAAHRLVDFERGDVQIRGSLMVDQQAPPPGGHTDLTVNRSLSGVWATPPGEGRGGRPWYLHTHRIDFQIPEVRTFYFAERGRDRHEAYTALRQTLAAISAREPGEPVYVRFTNHRNHGAALFRLAAGGKTYQGSVGAGFGANARAGDRWASPSFAPSVLNDLEVDVRSLRLLAHLTDGETPQSPSWPGGPCADRPACVGGLADRDGALAVQIVRDRDDAVLYEGSVYWHSKGPGHSEAVKEAATDAAWRDAIRSGAQPYGAEIKLGPRVRLEYDVAQTSGITQRLGFGALSVRHLRTFVEHWDETPTHSR